MFIETKHESNYSSRENETCSYLYLIRRLSVRFVSPQVLSIFPFFLNFDLLIKGRLDSCPPPARKRITKSVCEYEIPP